VPILVLDLKLQRFTFNCRKQIGGKLSKARFNELNFSAFFGVCVNIDSLLKNYSRSRISKHVISLMVLFSLFFDHVF
jgi:hypothetical protein